MSKTNVQTLSGNRVVVEFDGKVVGLCQSVRPSDDYGIEDVSGIGDIHVVEHVPTKAVHTIQVSTMTMMKGNLRNAGIAPENGDTVLKGNVFDICIYSKDDGSLLRKYTGCSYASGDIDISAHRIVMSSATFKALDVVKVNL